MYIITIMFSFININTDYNKKILSISHENVLAIMQVYLYV